MTKGSARDKERKSQRFCTGRAWQKKKRETESERDKDKDKERNKERDQNMVLNTEKFGRGSLVLNLRYHHHDK